MRSIQFAKPWSMCDRMMIVPFLCTPDFLITSSSTILNSTSCKAVSIQHDQAEGGFDFRSVQELFVEKTFLTALGVEYLVLNKINIPPCDQHDFYKLIHIKP